MKAQAISHTDAETLKGFVYDHIKSGSIVYTDDHRGYFGLNSVCYQHSTVKHSAHEYVTGRAHTNGIESVWALLKRGYTGTYHHFSMKHCQRYVNEFTFRLNEGNCNIDTMDRMNAFAKKIGGKRISYRDLISG